MNGISALIKEARESSLAPPPCEVTCEVVYKPGSRAMPDIELEHVATLTSDLQPPEL